MNSPDWMTKPSTSKIVVGTSYRVRSPADFYVGEMERHDTEVRIAVAANFALHVDPGCIEAHLFMGRHLKDPEQAMPHLQRAVETGDKLWEDVARREGGDMEWWGITATRPYMRAIHALGLAHREAGNEDEARECFGRLMEMNPNDNQGIRYLIEEAPNSPAPFR